MSWVRRTQLIIVAHNCHIDGKYLLLLQDFFFSLKPKQYKKCQYADCLKKNLETHKTKQIIWRNIWRSIFDRVERLGLCQNGWKLKLKMKKKDL